MNPLLQLDNISMHFPNKDKEAKNTTIKALSNIDLTVYPGEVIAVVGESGCGKTTLGKVISGLHQPTGGNYYYKGKDVNQLNKKRMRQFRTNIQLVQQDSYAALNPAKTIQQSLAAPIMRHKKAKGKKAIRLKIIELLETVGLKPAEQFLAKFPHQLSGGQRQRVLMARAISLDPEIIVADEPVSMVDVSLRLSILNLMSTLNKKLNIAFVYITHDLATARFIAQNGRLAAMYLGRIVELSSVGDIMSNPQHPYLQALLSAVPIPDPNVAKAKRELPLKSLEVPNLVYPPSGCAFHPRCPYATNSCSEECPTLRKVSHGLVACHHAERIPKWHLTASSN
ncbi:peptide/nickel transport system ATP-binding protein [Lederbergia galactosidilyticus]|uniref:ABC transporter ATP-binding protein n=1 Tax=Lederbergia galactosidilytica TaxID=217031 RepID=UPI001AE51EE1|nr:ABC transporter ATP-binding protein [Lederbergia galactosidilytica]MBP1916720.1 peptide/nickel transport system ATP-binding protein [Lederbergia galactosidilytica]